MRARGIKPADTELLTLEVLGSERLSTSFSRVTLGGGDVGRFRYAGFDQWFRLFIPVAEDSLSRLPAKLDTLAYMRYLTISKTTRPVLRNYSVSGFRADGPRGPELDVDFVLHGQDAPGSAGHAAAWSLTCGPGDAVAVYDEGVGFNPDPSLRSVILAADESGLPALGGVLSSLDPDMRGTAFVEVPDADDRRELEHPEGIDVRWIVREPGAAPGESVLAAACATAVPPERFYGWVVGEQSLASGLRRHWVRGGVSKNDIMFCGYWRSRH
ncbi:siderophore-interacting protein [Tomitella fengzijianii]|uniref:Siderophore-interacting protein n=2 Tax=Tomitella fengzijianii TaxID=2597660 RepID=A0A516X772_9ACTN|nr:siderophore-interacting protein [Tomitella fengzijianii]